MPRNIGMLSSRRVATAKPKRGRSSLVIADGGNLYLQATLGEAGNVRRSWVFRYGLDGERHEMGLGPVHTLSLAEAREKARELRKQLLDGVDPLAARESARQARLAEQARTVTFEQCAEMFLRLHEVGWGAAHRHQWNASLRTYVYPRIGGLPVRGIDQAVIMQLIEPLWSAKPVTASRVRSRIEAIFDYALAHKLREGDNPARVLAALPRLSNVAKAQHFEALPWQEVPQFMRELRGLDLVAARCLEFLILTAARTGEATGATWEEIPDGAKAWTIPAGRMKGGAEHRVPLPARALEILSALPRTGPLVFGRLPDAALRRIVLARLRPGSKPQSSTITAHGFRASFKTWASESTSFAPDIVEAALAHKRGNATTQAYERGDLFEKRRRLMDAWAKFCAQSAPAAGDVVRLRKRA
jgi:integrase